MTTIQKIKKSELTELLKEIPVEGKLTKLSLILLDKVKKKLRQTPKCYNQATATCTCNSPKCIIGLMREFANGYNHKEIGLTSLQDDKLYDASLWPSKYIKIGQSRENITIHAAIKRINHFIRTNGNQ